MFVIANFVHALASILDTILYLYMVVIVIRAVISWVNPDPYNPIVQFLMSVTEPVLAPVRRMIPLAIGIDISPIIVILTIMFIKSFLILSLHQWADRLQ